MKTIVVATDFSERSDRAIRRAELLAREFGSKLHLVHVVDDDQPHLIVQAQRDASDKLLEELTQTLQEIDGVQCDFRVVLGDPFIGITQAARNLGADLIVIGPHRRQLLRDILIGTTAERTIRTADRPVLLANGIPTGSYRRAIVATDLSAYSERTFRTAQSLGLLDRLNVSLLHVFSDPGTPLMSRASLSDDEKQSYLVGVRNRAGKEIASFMERINANGMSTILKPATAGIAETICETANAFSAELIVVGTCGRSMIARALMGSVTEGVLRDSGQDVLAIPPSQNAAVS
ncbi:Universal stress protein E [Rubripirellula lacrimiformis]|uniref:Universal stress protein E n=1 Tax=Rubripirellula lacrimiformis TaxID=1930273 RepID=A0A517NIV7_9BACT|nr:universal stress protein [Rubripirellula lacrimiformis]QDT07064.1 Universal stress protein E [Rubripirellula lacrimiformis]